MSLDCLRKPELFQLLYLIDLDLAEKHRAGGCRFCGGPLHRGNYARKPRGYSGEAEEWRVRLSFCCGLDGCRRRSPPPTTRFMGRRVYWSCVVLIVSSLIQGRKEGYGPGYLRRMFGIDRKTLKRWAHYYKSVFPKSRIWKRVRGRVAGELRNEQLPRALLERFLGRWRDPVEGVAACLRLVASSLGQENRG